MPSKTVTDNGLRYNFENVKCLFWSFHIRIRNGNLVIDLKMCSTSKLIMNICELLSVVGINASVIGQSV